MSNFWDVALLTHTVTEPLDCCKMLCSKMNRVKFLEYNNTIISASWDKSLIIWDSSFNKVRTIREQSGLFCCTVKISPTTIVTGSTDGVIRAWDIRSGNYLYSLKGHLDGVKDICLLQDGTLAAASYDKTISIWRLDTQKCISKLTGHRDRVFCIVQLKTGELCSTGFDKTVRVWNLNNQALNKTLRIANKARSLAQIDHSRIAVGDGAEVKIIDWQTGRCLQRHNIHTDDVMSMKLLSSGLLVTLGWDRAVRFWNLTSQQCIKVHCHFTQMRSLVELSPEKFLTGDQEGSLFVWDASTFKITKTIRAHTSAVDVLLY